MNEVSVTITAGEGCEEHNHGLEYRSKLEHTHDTSKDTVIELVPYDQTIFVQCSSHAKGKAVTSACEVGCIGCKKCEKTCPNGAITVTDFCAHIDYDKCTNCGACKEACPRHVIL